MMTYISYIKNDMSNDNSLMDTQKVMSLEERLIKSYAASTVESEKNKLSIQENLERNANLSPEELITLQNKVLNNNIEISLISAITRKTVGAVETLLRS